MEHLRKGDGVWSHGNGIADTQSLYLGFFNAATLMRAGLLERVRCLLAFAERRGLCTTQE